MENGDRNKSLAFIFLPSVVKGVKVREDDG